MGSLPPDFQFSQASLQDYVECARRFQLRYLVRLAWPAPVAEPMLAYEQHMLKGQAFHRLVHQHILGLPAERLSLCIQPEQAELLGWWQNYLAHAPARFAGERHAELGLSAALAEYRLVARYDLVVCNPGQGTVILDWKTASRRPARSYLAQRLQTRVYRYLLVRSGAGLNGCQPVDPRQVSMLYWFAAFPDDPERFDYDPDQFAADGLYLTGLVNQIASRADEEWPSAGDERACLYCVYRSLCERAPCAGRMAGADPAETGGPPDEEDSAAAGGLHLALDYEQIAEISF
jgi:hypothetical protein